MTLRLFSNIYDGGGCGGGGKELTNWKYWQLMLISEGVFMLRDTICNDSLCFTNQELVTVSNWLFSVSSAV